MVALVVVCLIAAQLVTFAVVVLTPPPQRPIYPLDEIVQALRGGSLKTRFGRDLVRAVQPEPPAEVRRLDAQPPGVPGRPPRAEFSRRQLAAMLSLPEGDVRLFEAGPSPTALVRGLFGVGGGGPRGERFRFEAGGPRGPETRGPGGGPDERFRGPPLFGDFTAAMRRPDGQWVVVRPAPEGFPTEWQLRLLAWLVGSLVVTGPLAYLFARRITAPLVRFATAADTLGRDPSGPLMELSGPAEIGLAARAFNDMQARLKRYVEDRTAMVGAISHDLRTPLARMRFKLEAAPPEVQASIMSDLEQMERMIASVLAFIRDASSGRPRERLDLLSLVECVVDDAVQAGQPVTLETGSAAVVEADSLGLQRLLGNLVDNAVKYGGLARLSVWTDAGEAWIEVRDEGPGLPQSELERVFQPFYRAEAARTLDGRGVGLGLAVARSIARAHGGDVVLERGAPGLLARVRLPLSAA